MSRSFSLTIFIHILPIAVALAWGGTVRAQGAPGYSLFGARGVNLQGATVNGGIVGSNNDVFVGSFSSFTALAGGGELNAQGPTVAGSVTFNGNVALGGANVAGPIDSGKDVTITAFGNTHAITAGGDVNFNGSTVSGNVTAGNDFNLGTFATINGNVGAGNNVTINGGTINGNLTYGNSLFIGPFGGTIQGTQTIGPVASNPTPYVPITLDPAIPFTSGGSNLTTGGTQANPLAPGSYGDLHLANFQDLYLGPGNYYFSSLEILNFQTIHLEGLTAENHINIFVTGDITEGALSGTTVDGVSFASADPTLAKNVLFETLGNFTQNALGGDQIFGTIFAPNGDVNFGQFSQVTGSVVGGGLVTSGPGFVEDYQSANIGNVPEPASAAMVGIGLLGGLAWTLGRRRTARAA